MPDNPKIMVVSRATTTSMSLVGPVQIQDSRKSEVSEFKAIIPEISGYSYCWYPSVCVDLKTRPQMGSECLLNCVDPEQNRGRLARVEIGEGRKCSI